MTNNTSKSLFKTGNIVRPVKGRNSSNYWSVLNIEEGLVTKVETRPYWRHDLIKVKIIKGKSYNSWYSANKHKGGIIEVYSDVLVLIARGHEEGKEPIYNTW